MLQVELSDSLQVRKHQQWLALNFHECMMEGALFDNHNVYQQCFFDEVLGEADKVNFYKLHHFSKDDRLF
jgi:hypothetical protein